MSQPDQDSPNLLGRSKNEIPAAPEASILETFANRHPQSSYQVHLDCRDFTSLCPVTGQPDAARIQIHYFPKDRIVETKSLKYYLASFRNHAAFNEDIVNQIAHDLTEAVQPKKLHVEGAFSARGGIQLTVEVHHPEQQS